jgi:hypothetical protein
MITLKTLHRATAQEVFDQAAKHLLTQNRKCENPDGKCKYRLILSDGEALKCAAGCFISDDEYKESLEDIPWGVLVGGGSVDETHSDLIDRLQYIHDNYPVERWEPRLAYLAEKLGLQFNIEKYK